METIKTWHQLAQGLARKRNGNYNAAFADIDLARELYGDEAARKGIIRLTNDKVSWLEAFNIDVPPLITLEALQKNST